MIKKYFKIENIPAILWGDNSDKVFIAIHGNRSNKEDYVIRIFAQKAVNAGYQVISFDLPEHGERRDEATLCKVQNCVKELTLIMKYVKNKWNNINLFACSMGAYFSLLSYKNEDIKKSLFLSPVVDMKRIINNMMTWFNIDENYLKEEETVEILIGQRLYWDYYCYVKAHPIDKWNCVTSILYGGKDDLCEKDIVFKFAQIFKCEIVVMDKGEHYFHTEEELKFFENWVEENI